jgi:DNA polymerase-3 subunit beta
MTFGVDTKAFLEILKFAQQATTTGGSVPALASVLIEADAQHQIVKLTATNYEITIRGRVGGEITESGVVAVPARQLAELLTGISHPQINVTMTGEASLQVKTKKSRYVLHGMPEAAFPATVPVKDPQGLVLGADLLMEMIERTRYCTSKDGGRPAFTGCCLKIAGANAEMVATDGVRLAGFLLEFEGPLGKELQVVIPRDSLDSLLPILKHAGSTDVTVKVDGNQLAVIGPDLQFTTRLISTKFPRYDHVIPNNNTNLAKCSREELMAALKRLMAISREDNFRVLFRFVGPTLTLITKPDAVGEAEEEIGIRHDGADLDIWINSQYVLDAVKSFGNEEVIFELGEPNRPVRLQPSPMNGEPYYAVVMPVTAP